MTSVLCSAENSPHQPERELSLVCLPWFVFNKTVLLAVYHFIFLQEMRQAKEISQNKTRPFWAVLWAWTFHLPPVCTNGV